MRRNKDGVLTTIDVPHCCECKEPLMGFNLFGHVGADNLSGYVEVITCDHCGHEQNISPSINWLTWDYKE